MDNSEAWVVAEAEHTVLAKYNQIEEALSDYECAKTEAFFYGAIGAASLTLYGLLDAPTVGGRFNLGILDKFDEMYGAVGIASIGFSVYAASKAIRAHLRLKD